MDKASMISWDLENTYHSQEHEIICGVDEAGRGPLAGPVFAAAVILPQGIIIDGLDDSKKINELNRNILYEKIKNCALSFAVARAEVHEIEEINILNASMLAMKRAVCGLNQSPNLILVDGNIARDFPAPAVPIIKGDSKCPSIAAASILAKVERDRFCREMDELYPYYGFAQHKGYATAGHRAAILKNGPCPLHRIKFLRKLLREQVK